MLIGMFYVNCYTIYIICNIKITVTKQDLHLLSLIFSRHSKEKKEVRSHIDSQSLTPHCEAATVNHSADFSRGELEHLLTLM